jgi:hypothetical protein
MVSVPRSRELTDASIQPKSPQQGLTLPADDSRSGQLHDGIRSDSTHFG